MSLKKSVINKMALMITDDLIRFFIINLIRMYTTIPETEMIRKEITVS